VSSDGVKLLARGSLVTLADDVPRQLILDMEALAVIEDRVGSISAYRAGLVLGFRGKVLKSVQAGLIAGLSHLEGKAALSPQRIVRLMKWDDIQAYIDALEAAWDEAIPVAKEPTSTGKDSGAASIYPGQSSTDESPSTMAAAAASSGA